MAGSSPYAHLSRLVRIGGRLGELEIDVAAVGWRVPFPTSVGPTEARFERTIRVTRAARVTQPSSPTRPPPRVRPLVISFWESVVECPKPNLIFVTAIGTSASIEPRGPGSPVHGCER